MDDRLNVQYARSAEGLHLAYAVMGVGPPDVARIVGAPTHLQLAHADSVIGSFETSVSGFCRYVIMDERGAGMSDPVALADLPTLEQRMDDVLAVLDAAGVERTHLLGLTSGAAVAVLLAVTHPARVESLVLVSPWARLARSDDYPIGWDPETLAWFGRQTAEGWGTGSFLDLMGPSVADTPFRARYAEYERASTSPGQAGALAIRGAYDDVRHLLPLVTVPTLVLHRRDNLVVPVELVRYVADHISGALYVELEGSDAFPFLGDVDGLVAEIELFVTGERSRPSDDRVLATVLFTDIVDSTGSAARLGDARWRRLLDEHDAMVRRQLERFRGREVATTGDGFVATFDGPARAIRCAQAVRDGARRLELEVRAGLHAGEVEVRGDDIAGVAVHIAARVLSAAGPGQVVVSSSVPALVAGSGISFAELGSHELKGAGRWELLLAEG